MGRGRGTPVTFSRHPRKTNGSPQEDGSATAPSQADPRRAETPLRGPGNRGRDPQDAAPRGGIQSPRKNPWIEAKSPQKNPLPQPGVPLKEAPTHTRDSLKKRPSRIRRWGSSPAQHGPQGESGGRGRPQGRPLGRGKRGAPLPQKTPARLGAWSGWRRRARQGRDCTNFFWEKISHNGPETRPGPSPSKETSNLSGGAG